MWIPRDYQVELAVLGYGILKKNAVVYYAMEERTGKSLTGVLTAEFCQNVESVLIITTAKAIEGWEELFANYTPIKKFTLTTFGKAKNHQPVYDLVIIDEAHKNISGYPKTSGTWRSVAKLCKMKPIIYMSATPHAQGYQLLYHQFKLSSWSPWKLYRDFYAWHRHFGIPNEQWINGRAVEQYNRTKESYVLPFIKHLFITRTRKELSFDYEPKDKVHYVRLHDDTKSWYNTLVKDKLWEAAEFTYIADTPMKLRVALHQIEGGALKVEDKYYVLPNTEKVDYIKETWGDVSSLVIFYNYKAEKLKLKEHFQNAAILQATAYAEGVDLTHYDTIVVYSQNFSTAQHTQRRARQASKHRDKEIVVHFLLVQKAISEQCYESVAVNKVNFVDSVFERSTL